jgi:hypothetical protein
MSKDEIPIHITDSAPESTVFLLPRVTATVIIPIEIDPDETVYSWGIKALINEYVAAAKRGEVAIIKKQTARGIRHDPRRLETLAMGILDAQGGKCAECAMPLRYGDATKRSHSFEIICRPCHDKPMAPLFTLDDIVDYDPL